VTADGFLLGVALILAILLVVGLIQALRVPRRYTRRIRPRDARRLSQRPPRSGSDAASRVFPPPTAPSPTPISKDASSPPEAAPVAATDEPAPRVAQASHPPTEEAPEFAGPRERELEECRRLFETGQYQEVLLRAEPHLQPAAAPDSVLAELWSLAGHARQALGDEEGARAAFDRAVHSAPEAEWAGHRRHLAALAALVGQRLLSRVERVGETSTGEERIATLRQAARWLKQGVTAAPEDAELASLLTRAHKGLWAGYGQTATTLIQRREFFGARRLLREALSDDDLPADRRETFKELLTVTFTGEIEQLTAQAIRRLDEEREEEGVALLERAERILDSMPTDAAGQEQLEAVKRRFWWGHTKLGLRRAEAGRFEDALGPLFRALEIDEVDPERQGETRAALILALNHVIKERASRIDRLMVEGKLEAAVGEGKWLRAVVEEGRQLGVREEELATALALARPVIARLDRARSGSSPPA
jgi:tetratricopeptide (TPR) repeat protein